MSRRTKRERRKLEIEAEALHNLTAHGEFLDPDMAAVHQALNGGSEWGGHQYVDDRLLTDAEIRDLNDTPGLGFKPESKPKINAALAAKLMQQVKDGTKVKLAPVPYEDFTDPITWVIAGNGVFCYRQTRHGLVCIRAGKEATIPGLPDQINTDFQMAYPKMPWLLFQQAVAFLRWVKATHDTEGLIRGYYNPTDGWQLHVPNQLVSGASVLVPNDEPDPNLGVFAWEIHSHPGKSSVFSGTDDANEQMERIFGCAGDLGKADIPNFHWRIGTGHNVWQDVDITEVIDAGAELIFKITPLSCLRERLIFDPFNTDKFPVEWKGRVRKETFRVVTPQGAGGYRNYKDWEKSRLPQHYHGINPPGLIPGAEAARTATTDRFDSGGGVSSRIMSVFGRVK